MYTVERLAKERNGRIGNRLNMDCEERRAESDFWFEQQGGEGAIDWDKEQWKSRFGRKRDFRLRHRLVLWYLWRFV